MTGTTPEGQAQHRYVAKVLAAAFPEELKAIIVVAPPYVSLSTRILKYWKRYSIPQLLSRVRAKVRSQVTQQEQRRQATYKRILFPDGDEGRMPHSEIVRVVPSHNGKKSQEVLDELRPDVIAVYGTMVIKPAIIRKATIGVLNMHTGISPRYRGSDTVFWPLHNEEPEWVGVTVHRLDEGIDSGAIISTAKPIIEADDDEDSLFAKCVIMGARNYVAAIRSVACGTAQETPQDLAAGREYFFVDRTVAADKKVAKLLREGMLVRFANRRS
jgi:methionyl-tRNA formyltransferase